MGERVDVDAGSGDRRRVGAGLAADDLRCVEVGRPGGGVGELAGELAEDEVLAAGLDQPEGGDVPERGRAAVAEHDLPSVGEGEQLAQPGAHLADDVAHRCLPVAMSPSSSGRPQPGPPSPRGGPSTDRSRSGRRAAAASAGIWMVGAEVTVPA